MHLELHLASRVAMLQGKLRFQHRPIIAQCSHKGILQVSAKKSFTSNKFEREQIYIS